MQTVTQWNDDYEENILTDGLGTLHPYLTNIAKCYKRRRVEKVAIAMRCNLTRPTSRQSFSAFNKSAMSADHYVLSKIRQYVIGVDAGVAGAPSS